MQYQTRRRRQFAKQLEKELQDLRFEKESLELLRDCKPLWDALSVYLEKATLNERERAEVRLCLQILCRGYIGK